MREVLESAGRIMASRIPPQSLCELISRYDPDPIDLPQGSAIVRLSVDDLGRWDAALDREHATLDLADPEVRPDARLRADLETWDRIADDVRGGMEAFREGRLHVRQNLHLGVGFLAATNGASPGRLRFGRVDAGGCEIAYLSAGSGEGDAVVCIHGLGGTKASFLPTVAALAGEGQRVVALDLPGFGDSDKPIAGGYDAPYFARVVSAFLDRLELSRVHLVGNSMGGRIAIELGLTEPQRVGGIVLLSPALAWLSDRPLRRILSLPLPKLGLIQPAPRRIVEPVVRRLIPGARNGWTAAGVDEFLRAYLTAGGRHAFYEAARRIYLDEPHGEDGFWIRLAELQHDCLFVWGRHDTLVPLAFRKHVERALPAARHLELDCGHVPQLERPRKTHEAIAELIGSVRAGTS